MRSRRSRRTAAPNRKPRRRRHKRIRAAAARHRHHEAETRHRSSERLRQPQHKPEIQTTPSSDSATTARTEGTWPTHRTNPAAATRNRADFRQGEATGQNRPAIDQVSSQSVTERQQRRVRNAPISYHGGNRAPARHPLPSGQQSISPHPDTAASEADEAPRPIASAAAAHTTPYHTRSPSPKTCALIPKQLQPQPQRMPPPHAAHPDEDPAPQRAAPTKTGSPS